MNDSLKNRTIEAFEPLIENAKWKEDDVRQNTDPDSPGGYSVELTEAIDILAELKGA